MQKIDWLKYFRSKFPRELGKTIPQMLKKAVEESPDTTLQAFKNEIGSYEYQSYKLVYRHILNLACSLKSFGIKRGDLIGLISDNRREWFITDMALLCLGAADVPRGCDSMGTEITFILNFTSCKVCFFENERQLEKVLDMIDEVPELKDAILFDSPSDLTMERAAMLGIRVHKFIDLEDSGKRSTDSEREEIEAEIEKTEGSDLATIIFTSGTTGTPKGVMLSHDNFIAQCEVIQDVLTTAKEGDMWLSILPVWHIMERCYTYCIIALKSGIAYSKPAVEFMKEDIAAINPHWIVGVPRLWDAFTQSWYREQKRKSGLDLWRFNCAMFFEKSFCWAHDRLFGLVCRFSLKQKILDRIKSFIPFLLIAPFAGLSYLCDIRKLRRKFGTRIKGCICGGGSMQPENDLIFRALRIPLLDCYGMTETAPFLALRSPKKPMSGCIGKVFPSAEVKVVPEKDGVPLSSTPLGPGKRGLIFARGRQVMKGYYRRPDVTKSILDNEGWINTGDLGMLSSNNELTITGRAKDTIVLMGGENIEPQIIENAICRSIYVESCVAVGQDKKYIGALIVARKDNILHFAKDNNIYYDTYETLLETSEVQNLIREEIDRFTDEKNGFRTCEKVGKFTLLSESFRIGQEINAKQVVMRHKIEKIYAKEIARLFASRSNR